MAIPDATALRKARASLALASGKKKLELLLEGEGSRHLIQALPAQELYLAMLDIGLDDCAEVVALSSPQQFKHFIDASCWPRSDAPPDPRKIMRWLTLAREGGGGSDLALRRFHTKLASLDAELFSLLLRRELKVHDLTENEFPELSDEAQGWYSPDRKYLVEFNEEGSPAQILKRLLDDLATENAFHVSRLLESLRWELPSELEETARRWRDGRLRDLGVPDLEEALAFVARPLKKKGEPDAAAIGLHAKENGLHSNIRHTNDISGAGESTALATQLSTAPLLDRAMQTVTDSDLPLAEESIAYAANASLVAWKIQVDDPAELRPALANTRAILSLGLEILSHGDEAQAAEILVQEPVRTIFQAAMGELYRLQSRARLVAKAARLPEAKRVTLLGPPHAGLLDALEGQPPQISGVRMRAELEHAPESLAEIARAELLLDEAAALPKILAALGLTFEQIGAAATQAERAVSSVRASDALAALALADLRGVPFSLTVLPEPSAGWPEGFVQRLDARLAQATASLQNETPEGPERSAASRMLGRLRTQVLAR